MGYSGNWIKANQFAIVDINKVMLTGEGQEGQKYSIVSDVPVERIEDLYSLTEREDTLELQLTDAILDLTVRDIETRYHIDPRDYFKDSTGTVCTLEAGDDRIDYVDPITGIIASLMSGGEIYFSDAVSYVPDEEDQDEFNAFLEVTEFFDIDKIKYDPLNVIASEMPQLDKDHFTELTFSDIEQYKVDVVNNISGVNFSPIKISITGLRYKGEDKITRVIPPPQNTCADVIRKIQRYRIGKGDLKKSQVKILEHNYKYRKDTLSLLSDLLQKSNCNIEVFMSGKSTENKGEDPYRVFIPDKAYVIINKGDETKSLSISPVYGFDLAYLFDNLSITEKVIDATEMNGDSSKKDADIGYIQ